MGLALIRRNLEGLSNDFYLFGQNQSMAENIVNFILIIKIMLIVIFTTYFVLICTLLYGVLKKYFFGRDLSMFLVITYSIMFVSVTIIAIW